MKNLLRSLALFLLLPTAAFATQSNLVAGNFPTSSPYPGLTLVNNINTAMTTLSSQNAGSSAPSYAASYMIWADTSNNLLKFTPDGTNFYPMGYFSGGWTATSDGIKPNAVTSTGSSNAYVVTYSPAAAALVTGHIYNFITNFANTGAATVNFNSLGAIPLKKQGGTALASGDLGSGLAVSCVYDGTNCQVISQLSQSSGGTVTSIATNNGVTGGTITTSGTIGLATIGSNTILGNSSGSTAVPVGTATPSVTSWGISGTSSASGSFTGIHTASGTNLSLAAGGSDAVTVYGADQGVTVGSPTGGDQGAGTINASGLYVNGTAVATATPSALGVGSIIMSCYDTGGSISAGSTTSSTNLHVLRLQSGGTGNTTTVANTSDAITGTWQALQTLAGTGGGGCTSSNIPIGWFQRTL